MEATSGGEGPDERTSRHLRAAGAPSVSSMFTGGTMSLHDLEMQYILRVLEQNDGNKPETAKQLGITPAELLRIAGQVVEIAPLAGVLGGDVVYKATITPNSQPEGLRAVRNVARQSPEVACVARTDTTRSASPAGS